MYEQEEIKQFIHEMSNNLMSIQGKVLKIKLLLDNDPSGEVQKLESCCADTVERLKLFKKYLERNEE